MGPVCLKIPDLALRLVANSLWGPICASHVTPSAGHLGWSLLCNLASLAACTFISTMSRHPASGAPHPPKACVFSINAPRTCPWFSPHFISVVSQPVTPVHGIFPEFKSLAFSRWALAGRAPSRRCPDHLGLVELSSQPRSQRRATACRAGWGSLPTPLAPDVLHPSSPAGTSGDLMEKLRSISPSA